METLEWVLRATGVGHFAINGAAMQAPFKPGTLVARTWAVFWVVAPLPLPFHPWFIRGIVMLSLGVS